MLCATDAVMTVGVGNHRIFSGRPCRPDKCAVSCVSPPNTRFYSVSRCCGLGDEFVVFVCCLLFMWCGCVPGREGVGDVLDVSQKPPFRSRQIGAEHACTERYYG